MKKAAGIFQQYGVITHLLKWTILSIPVALVVGTLVALFLWLLDAVTNVRQQHQWLLYGLPMAGIFIYFLYKWSGKNVEAGNNLVIKEIHEPGAGVPARMTPLILVTTIITHLMGGSAGREGTAVQMGGSMAQLLAKWFRLNKQDVSIILICGVAAGFGAVFGTPVTGAIFALEVLVLGRMKYDALVPCLIASVLADQVCTAWNIHHTKYSIQLSEFKSFIPLLNTNLNVLITVIASGVCFGLVAYLFVLAQEQVKSISSSVIRQGWLRPFVGGLLVIGLSFLLGTDYLGLGVTNPHSNGVSIVSAFEAGGADPFSWLWKLIFTAITLGMGFKGGEVTPLFFIGATLGNTLAALSGTPFDLMAGLGFIAVFAAATNTPVACTIMGVELFGGDYILYYAVACFTAYYFSGQKGIYAAQKQLSNKVPR